MNVMHVNECLMYVQSVVKCMYVYIHIYIYKCIENDYHQTNLTNTNFTI